MYQTKTLANLEALYEPGESTVALCDWTVEGASPLTTLTLAITQERLLMCWFKRGRFGGTGGGAGSGNYDVSTFAFFSLANITGWSFDKVKTTKGDLVGYNFCYAFRTLDGAATARQATVFAEGQQAEPFRDVFEAAMARHAALTMPVDMAGQLRALHKLVDEGVLTEEEMRRAKDLFLGRPPDRRQQMEQDLRRLYGLMQTGVLNKIEFDIKKRDILATAK